MKRILATLATVASIATLVLGAAGTASASPPPPSPLYVHEVSTNGPQRYLKIGSTSAVDVSLDAPMTVEATFTSLLTGTKPTVLVTIPAGIKTFGPSKGFFIGFAGTAPWCTDYLIPDVPDPAESVQVKLITSGGIAFENVTIPPNPAMFARLRDKLIPAHFTLAPPTDCVFPLSPPDP